MRSPRDSASLRTASIARPTTPARWRPAGWHFALAAMLVGLALGLGMAPVPRRPGSARRRRNAACRRRAGTLGRRDGPRDVQAARASQRTRAGPRRSSLRTLGAARGRCTGFAGIAACDRRRRADARPGTACRPRQRDESRGQPRAAGGLDDRCAYRPGALRRRPASHVNRALRPTPDAFEQFRPEHLAPPAPQQRALLRRD